MSRFSYIAVTVCFFLIGLIFGFNIYSIVINRWLFTIDKVISFQIDPMNVISAIVTLVVGVIVVRAWSQKDGRDKTKKDYLIGLFVNFDTEFIERVRKFAKGGCLLDDTVAVIKRYRMRIQKLLDLAYQEKMLSSSCGAVLELTGLLKQINELLTSTPKAGGVEDGIRVRLDNGNEILDYSENQKDKIACAIFDINCCIYKLGVEIHKSKI